MPQLPCPVHWKKVTGEKPVWEVAMGEANQPQAQGMGHAATSAKE